MSEPITDEEAFAVLIAHCLNELHAHECCPQCCYPCNVLKRLADRPDGPGSLNAILTVLPDDLGAGDWQTPTGVDKQWMDKQWSRTDCHGEFV